MKKKVTVLTACTLCAAGVVAGVSAAGVIQKVQSEIRPDFTVKVDGKVRTFKNVDGDTVYPMLYEGTTYLPVRAIGELMGKTVYWYEDDKLIELKDKDTTVTDADVIVPGTTVNPKKTKKPSKPEKTIPPGAEGISIEKAKEIALKKAGLSADEVFFKKESYDFDDGRWVYDIEFVKDRIEYSAEILISDGTIVSWDIDRD